MMTKKLFNVFCTYIKEVRIVAENIESTLVVVCGWPLSGKGTIARHLAKDPSMHWIDIDDVRVLNFGPPNPHPNISEEAMRRDKAEMKGSYELLYAAIGITLAMRRPLIVSATFSRAFYWEPVIAALARHPEGTLRILWCKPKGDTEGEIRRRLSKRHFGVNCWSSVNSVERYEEVKGRYEAPTLSLLQLDTSSPRHMKKCVEEARAYVLS
jgi:predicted kinase